MAKKLNLAIICGGKSAEHEVSIFSARSILAALDKKKYNLTLIGIDRLGEWFLINPRDLENEKKLFAGKNKKTAALPFAKKGKFFIKTGQTKRAIDAVFPVLHGPYGEDGTMQGLLKLFNVPFVGSSVLGSAIGMDKDVTKRLLRDAGLPVAPFLAFHRHELLKINFQRIKKQLDLPLFVKPANLGSSVGVSKVKTKAEFASALELAFSFDKKIIIEKFIPGREIECAVLGNGNPIASVPGEIILTHDFYSYEAKYIDENGAAMSIPADLPKTISRRIQALAKQAFAALDCEGMGRVDFFLTPDNKIHINEINTIPGFTSISMYPRLWEKSGLACSALIDRLIGLAIERFEEEKKLKNKQAN